MSPGQVRNVVFSITLRGARVDITFPETLDGVGAITSLLRQALATVNAHMMGALSRR